MEVAPVFFLPTPFLHCVQHFQAISAWKHGLSRIPDDSLAQADDEACGFIIMRVLLVYIEPNKACIMLPQCEILDSVPESEAWRVTQQHRRLSCHAGSPFNTDVDSAPPLPA